MQAPLCHACGALSTNPNAQACRFCGASFVGGYRGGTSFGPAPQQSVYGHAMYAQRRSSSGGGGVAIIIAIVGILFFVTMLGGCLVLLAA